MTSVGKNLNFNEVCGCVTLLPSPSSHYALQPYYLGQKNSKTEKWQLNYNMYSSQLGGITIMNIIVLRAKRTETSIKNN